MNRNFTVKIYKMGPKLGLFLSENWLKINGYSKGDIVNITMRKNDKEISFLTKINRIISLRRKVVTILKLKYGNIVSASINKVCNLKRSTKLFENNKIDLLSLIPYKTSYGYEIIVIEFIRNNEKWLRIWYSHKRGSARQIELKRFINIKFLGYLFGQLQAEGTKCGRKFRLDFSNKLILEHKNFIESIEQIGINKNLLTAELTIHRNFNDDINRLIIEYQKITRVPIKYIQKSPQNGYYGFKTYIRSTILTEILISALSVMRKILVAKDWDKNLAIFADAFLSKLLTGDGSIDVQTRNRQSNYPLIRITITDGNTEYLDDYSKIIKKLGFRPHINYKYKKVRAICSLEKLLYLYKIRAFENSNNWNKLLLSIALCLKGRRYRTNYRFIDLSKLETFTSLFLAENYNVSLSSANDWLFNKEKEGLAIKVNSNYLKEWKLTEKAIKLASLLESWYKEFNELIVNSKTQNPLDILDSLKVRGCHFQPKRPAI